MSPDSIKKPMHKAEFIVLMALLMSIVAVSIDALLPALGIIGGDFALQNPNHAQYLIGCIFIGMAVGELLWGPLSDAVGRKPVLYAGTLLYLVGSALCYVSDNFLLLLAGRILQGVGVAGPYVCCSSIVRDKYAGRDMARIMSIVMMIFILVPAIAPSLGQGLLWLGSWRYVFLFYMGYATLIALWIFLRMEETLARENRVPYTVEQLLHGLREVTSNRITCGYMFCMGICFGGFLGYLNSAQQIFQVQFKTGETFTLYFGGLALVLGVASLVNALIVKRLGMVYICKRSFAAIVLISAAFLALHGITEITLYWFLFYAALLFFCFGMVFGNLNAIAMEPMGHIAGMASAIIGAVSSLLSMFLGGLIGQLYDNTLIPMTVGFIVLGAIATGILFWAEKGRVRAIPAAA